MEKTKTPGTRKSHPFIELNSWTVEHTNFFQPSLFIGDFALLPVEPHDFDALYAAASDPLIWAMHPNPFRYRLEDFRNFFQGAIKSGGAMVVRDERTGMLCGSTRFYDWDPKKKEIFIGYTFYARKYWGTGLNAQIKRLMLDYLFTHTPYVKVRFHVGKENYRSRRAMEKLGAHYQGEVLVAYHGEPPRENVEYLIEKPS